MEGGREVETLDAHLRVMQDVQVEMHVNQLTSSAGELDVETAAERRLSRCGNLQAAAALEQTEGTGGNVAMRTRGPMQRSPPGGKEETASCHQGPEGPAFQGGEKEPVHTEDGEAGSWTLLVLQTGVLTACSASAPAYSSQGCMGTEKIKTGGTV